MFLLGLVVYARNPKQHDNQNFAFVALALVSWTIFNYLSDNSLANSLLYTRLTFLAGVLSAFGIINFIANFTDTKVFKSSKLIRAGKLFTVLLVPVVFSQYFISAVSSVEGEEAITVAFLYPLFLLFVIYMLFLMAYILIRQNQMAVGAKEKQQVKLISFGIAAYCVLAVSANVLLPLIINNWSSSRFGPVFTLILVADIGYTIIKHRLFDIRLIIARALGYLFSIGIFSLLYAVLAFVLVDKLFLQGQVDSLAYDFIYLGLAIMLAVTFSSLRRFFDRVTNILFFRDAYDPQQFLDKFNSMLVSTIDLEPLLKGCAQVVQEHLKVSYCSFTIRRTSYSNSRNIGGQNKAISEDDVRKFSENLSKLPTRVVVTDELTLNNKEFISALRKNDIAIIARLTSNIESGKEGIGYLLLGSKKSGNPYNRQDIRIIEIIANELVIAIQNALRFEEIEKFNITLRDKVDDATKQLRVTNEKLKTLDETKDEFISMASHQLRTPLTSVKGYLSMVLEGDAGDLNEMQNKLLNQAFVSSQRMVYLIADLLNVSRLRTGKFIIEPIASNLADVIKGEVSQLQDTAKSRGLTLTFDKPESFPTLMLDETKIRQVIMNFMDNAIYYTLTGGHITVELRESGKTVEYIVHDDGIGVPKSEQHHLFTKFYRARNAKKARPDGTGLGLFMAKKVIIAQGGAVIFKSEEGKGSTFGFSFEKAKLSPENSDKTPPKA